MPPKLDPNRVDFLTIKCVGGEPSVASSLGPKLGSFGVPPKKVAEEIANQTKNAKGSKVTVQLRIQNRQATVTLIETSSYLILRALKTPVRDRKKQKNVQHNGNLSFDQVVEIARKMREKSMAKELKGTIKEILGTCQSIGCSVDGSNPREVIRKINEGELVCPVK